MARKSRNRSRSKKTSKRQASASALDTKLTTTSSVDSPDCNDRPSETLAEIESIHEQASQSPTVDTDPVIEPSSPDTTDNIDLIETYDENVLNHSHEQSPLDSSTFVDDDYQNPTPLHVPSNIAADVPSQVSSDVTGMIQSNTSMLEQVAQEIAQLRGLVSTLSQPESHLQSEPANSMATAQTSSDEQAAVWEENDALRLQVQELQQQLAELEQQNDDLASQVASENIRRTVSDTVSDRSEALSWEERKDMILRQMEEDTFDAESFIDSIQPDERDDQGDPVAYVHQLNAELDRRLDEVQRRESEVKELQALLQQQSETRDCSGVAIGAAAIAELVEGDELIREEREKLQSLQAQWEERFRESEITASLERAKLSRERRELALKNAELEEQLVHFRRESEETRALGGGTSRRWMAKLGLTDVGD